MIPMFKVAVAEGASAAAAEVLSSGMLGEGPKVAELTDRLRPIFQTENVILLNSCTSAITMALRLFGIGHGSKVLTTPFTMVATSCAIAATGAEPVWCDIDDETLSFYVRDLKNKLPGKDALVMTLVGGLPPLEMDLISIHTQCRKLGIPFIIDGAHALATYIQGNHVSNYCDAFCASFQAIKHLTTGGDGGALVLNSDTEEHFLNKAERLKWFGLSRQIPEGKTRLEHQMTQDVPDWGYKFHMNDVAAAIGLANFDLAFQNIAMSTRNALRLNALLEEVEQVQGPRVEFPETSSWWAYPLLVKRRDELLLHLEEKGITSTPMWRRNDRYSAFKPSPTRLRGMDKVEKEILFVPNGFWVSLSECDFIAETIKDFYK